MDQGIWRNKEAWSHNRQRQLRRLRCRFPYHLQAAKVTDTGAFNGIGYLYPPFTGFIFVPYILRIKGYSWNLYTVSPFPIVESLYHFQIIDGFFSYNGGSIFTVLDNS